MGEFSSFDGTTIVFDDLGEGPPVVMLHGFAADARANWHQPKVVEAVVASGRRVITPDARGHGRSGKPHDVAAYKDNAMPRDVSALLDHLDLEQVDLVGYSMGGRVTALVAIRESRVRSIVLGGVGVGVVQGGGLPGRDAIADALTAADPAGIGSARARAFRQFAESTGADREALAAVMRAGIGADANPVGAISVPALVICGDRDDLVGDSSLLAQAIPGAEHVIVNGDHLTAVGDPKFRQAIADFLSRVAR
ncbi:MAG TPA: alpha/beta hydrolase [Acidimicrobiales bacterium]|nr:alpha/beta hydrolase [Acidimicrobiales bacterium]